MTETCKTCRFWSDDVIFDADDHFTCGKERPNWPWVTGDDWCGEYEAKEERNA